jgi:catechol 2,3-dioxygenase-like lactoylglutathione lyase family enzyme
MQKFFYKSVPFLPVKDLAETIRFYKTLGFTGEWLWGSPPTDAGIRRDELSLLFNHNPELAEKMEGFELVIFVDNVDDIFNEFNKKREIQIIAPLQDEPWGIREFSVKDNNGYRLRISCSLQRIQRLAMAN